MYELEEDTIQSIILIANIIDQLCLLWTREWAVPTQMVERILKTDITPHSYQPWHLTHLRNQNMTTVQLPSASSPVGCSGEPQAVGTAQNLNGAGCGVAGLCNIGWKQELRGETRQALETGEDDQKATCYGPRCWPGTLKKEAAGPAHLPWQVSLPRGLQGTRVGEEQDFHR